VIRVLVIDDNAVIRGGIRSLLEATEDIEVVGEGSTGKDAVELTDRLQPDVVLCDVRMPVMNGIEAASRISRATKVLMLTYAEEEELVAGAIRNGAWGYLVHGRFEPEQLEDAVRDVVAGRNVISPAVVPMVFDALRRGPDEPPDAPHSLTEREREVANLLARGRSNKEIAEELFISEKTVKNHINHVYAKLGVTTRAEAIAAWLGVAGAQVGFGPARPPK
jgi:DNA-binding NarL/FixJ family response regulator